jgi:hypothetical protein
MNCPSCAAELPADARFCVECGAEVLVASTGATTALPRYADPGPPCPACGAVGPEGADYCVRCGRRLADPLHVPPPPAPVMATRPPRLRPAMAAPPLMRHRRRRWQHVGGPVFLIGLGMLFLLKLPFFPAILVVAGLSMFVSAAARGSITDGFRHAFWLFGLALLFTIPRLWVPIMVVLIGLNVLFDVMCRAARRP